MKSETGRKSRENIQPRLAGSAVGLWDWDISTGKLHSSDRYQELLGYAADEFPVDLEEFWNRVHPDDYQAVRQAVDRHLTERIPYQMDLRLRTKSGKYRWFHTSGQASWDDGGKATRMSGALLDITLRKQTEEALQKSEERYELVTEASGVGVWDWEIETGRVYLSDQAKRLMGFDSEEEGTHVDDFWGSIHPDDLPGVKQAVERHFETRVPYCRDYRYRTKSGEYRWFTVRAQSVWDETGKPLRAVGTLADITDRKKADDELQTQREAMARVARVTRMEKITGAIAHELNQPLTGILSTAQAGELAINRGECDHDEMAEILAEIAADAKRAGEVIHGLREIYRVQGADLRPVDINALVRDTEKLLHSEFILKKIELVAEYAPAAPMVSGNRVQLQQVLINLLMNAAEAMSETGKDRLRVHIRTVCEESEVKALVEDFGPGIGDDRLETIFEPLATWKPGGTGMGLALSNSIIEAHGGSMWAENRPGGGARVGFTLPAMKEESGS